MTVVALKSGAENFFEAAERKFSEIVGSLKTQESKSMKFSELETMLETEGRELLRLMLQAHVDLRGNGDVGLTIEGTDNILRTHKRMGERQLKSIFGKIELERLGYGNRGIDSLFPKDSHLNLPETSYSHELERRVVAEVIQGSFGNAVEAIAEKTGVLIPKQQAEHITVHAALDFEAYYEKNLSKEKLEEANKQPLLILTTDGKGIVMHKEDLRPITRKRAEKENKKLQMRLSAGEKKNSKRMATVASVYNIALFKRHPDDFRKELSSIKGVEEDIPHPRAVAKRVWASVEKTPEEVIEEMFLEAERRDPDKKKTWVVLVDGAVRPIEYIENEARLRGISLTIVCDIIHVIEYLWKAAWAFFEKGNLEAERWVTERFIAILEGKASQVAAGIRRSATNRKFRKKEREAIDVCADYLLNKAPYLKYNEYLEQGFPIATGVIEGACRHLIKDRMDLTGARWGLKGAEAVLKLRSLKASGDFPDYWSFYEQQEFIRNHKSKYKKPSVINKLHIQGV